MACNVTALEAAPLKPISNGPRAVASMSGLYTAAKDAHMRAQAGDSAELLPCIQCRNTLPSNAGTTCNLVCLTCRASIKERNSKRDQELEKVRAKIRAIAASAAFRPEGVTDPPLRPLKRKADGILDTPAGAQEAARPSKVSASARKREEFQMADALLAELAARWQQSVHDPPTNTKRTEGLNFHGSYAVVRDPAVSNAARAEQLVSTLSADKRFSVGQLVKRVTGTSKDAPHSQHHWCTCRGLAPPPKPQQKPTAVPAQPRPAPTAAATPGTAPNTVPALKRTATQGTLARWLSSAPAGASASKSQPKSKSAVGQEPPGRGVCGGTVEIAAYADLSHTLAEHEEGGGAGPAEGGGVGEGMRGQRVTVRVRHPGWWPAGK
ncbi:hypothetical protein C2E23DRAFT_900530 [Lenzites betulinus]|nr:hypothetical protein C2E23DRAFT_900530 [Lenzites betulinus]